MHGHLNVKHTHTYQPSPERPSNIWPDVTSIPVSWGANCYSGEKLWPWQRGWGVLYLWEKLSEKTCRSCEKYNPLSLSTDGDLLGIKPTTNLERHICKNKARQNASRIKQVYAIYFPCSISEYSFVHNCRLPIIQSFEKNAMHWNASL